MAGFDVFLKLDGIDGESTTKGHEKEIKVVSYDQSIDSTVAAVAAALASRRFPGCASVSCSTPLQSPSLWHVHPASISKARVSRSGAPALHWIFTSSRSKTSS
jgi:hypothetical protein